MQQYIINYSHYGLNYSPMIISFIAGSLYLLTLLPLLPTNYCPPLQPVKSVFPIYELGFFVCL